MTPNEDPLVAGPFMRIVEQARFPPMTFGRLRIDGREAWADVARRATPLERGQLLRRLRRRLLCLTPDGRRRLRAYVDGRKAQPIAVDSASAHRRRLGTALQYFGDHSVFGAVIDGLMQCPRPVQDHAIERLMFVVTGRETNGWTSGPLPTRWPVLLAGHRSDVEVAETVRHEAAHRWLEPDPQPAPSALQEYEALACCRQVMGRARADAFARGLNVEAELFANACAIGWSNE